MTYPAWIDEYARAIHKAFVNMTPAEWGPLNFYDCFAALDCTFLDKLHQAIELHKKRGTSMKELIACFPSPSGFRADAVFLLYEYTGSERKEPQKMRESLDYLLTIANAMFVRDPLGYESNVIHTDQQIDELVKRIRWSDGTPEYARAIARLGNSGSAVSYALYRDFYVAESQEVYAPYDVSRHFGPNTTLVIKHYPKMRPVELWKETANFPHAEMKLYLVYENVHVTCELIGMHTLYEGDIINGLRKWAVEIDGVFYDDIDAIKREQESIAQAVVDFWPVYESMSKDDLKMKFLEWVTFSFAPFFKLVGMDAKPTPEMIQAVRSKDARDRVILPGMPPYDEWVNDPEWEVYWLKDLYKA